MRILGVLDRLCRRMLVEDRVSSAVDGFMANILPRSRIWIADREGDCSLVWSASEAASQGYWIRVRLLRPSAVGLDFRLAWNGWSETTRRS